MGEFDIDHDMLEHFGEHWKVVSGDMNHRLSPGSKMYVNRDAAWIVGPTFRSEHAAREFLATLRAAFELLVERNPRG